ncbi:universal stress protein [Massilia yuzhufengensis]|uniref:Universal stress protein family protein n=1 Tax=Massilia yuzhufengensis TaxID=1164594 RepID=A0A1I1E7L0_9BURK|nr:universal stress protein [Massilia yuzhufengensis]SFB83101.1 Universal stress protein family protein [Massilia yuzhufengensis]
MFKTIVVHVDDSPLFDARLQAAAWLANAHEAHLVGCATTGMSWPAYALLTGSMAVTPIDEFESLRVLARGSLARFAERAGQLGVQSLEQRLVEDENRDALLLQARYADLVVTGQDAGDAATVRGLPQYLAMHGVRPVLVVPPAYAGAPIADTVVIGWDGSMQALRAIGGAMPILTRARDVRLALVNPDLQSGLHGEEPGADMALFLARHGVRVEVLGERTLASTGDALLGIVRASGAGLLVAGAFGHSRYREIVLGGVTRVLLDRAPVPVLVAH